MDNLILHKFHKLNFHLIELLTSSSFYCAAPKALNDPYDCFVNLTLDAIEYYIRNKKFHGVDITDIIEKYRLSRPWQVDDDMKPVQQVDFKLSDEGLAMKLFADHEKQSNFVNDLIEKINVRVTSFVKAENEWKNTNLRMWAQYADNSYGVRMCFNFNEDKYVKPTLKKVKYEPFIFTLGGDAKPLQDAFHHKLKYFDGEDETRCITHFQYLSFEKNSLRDITFGMNVSDMQAYALIQVVEALNYGCVYYRMTKTATGLEPIEIVVGKEKIEQREKEDFENATGAKI